MLLRLTRKLLTALVPAAIIGIGFLPLAALAQGEAGDSDVPQTVVLGPNSAAALAVENSLGLEIDAQTVAEAEFALKQTLALDSVKVTLSGSLVRIGPEPSLPPGFESFYIKTIHTETLTATKPVWSWGRSRAQRQFARSGIEAAKAGPAVTRLAISKLARLSLLRLVFQERMLDIDYHTLAGLMEHQRVTDKRYREGLIAFFEIAQADARVADQEKFIAERKSMIVRESVTLRQLVRLPQTTPIDVSVKDLPARPVAELGEAIQAAIDQRPEMARARMAVRLQEASERVATTSLRPSINVRAQVQDQTAGFTSSPITYSVAIAFEKQIFDGGAKKQAVREARAGIEKARLRMEQTAEVIAAEVATAYLQIDHELARIDAAMVQERAALEQLRIARLRYEADIGLGREVIDAQSEVSRAQTDRALAELDLYSAIVQLRSAMGMLDLQEAPVE